MMNTLLPKGAPLPVRPNLDAIQILLDDIFPVVRAQAPEARLSIVGRSPPQWLRRRVSKTSLQDWLKRRRGAGLSSRQLRFWELILDLPHRLVNTWLDDPGRQAWEQRRHA